MNSFYYLLGFFLVLEVGFLLLVEVNAEPSIGEPNFNQLGNNNQHHSEQENLVNKSHAQDGRTNVFDVIVEQIQKLPEKLGLEPEAPAPGQKKLEAEKVLAKEAPVAELDELKHQNQARNAKSPIVNDPGLDDDAKQDQENQDEEEENPFLPHEENENDRKARALGLDFGEKSNLDNTLFQSVRLCGYSPRAGPSRLSNASPGQFPWSASILGMDNRFLCAGTLISESIVLTTASCILSYQKINEPLKVRLGVWSLPDGYEYLPELDVNVRAAVLHPLYNQAGNAHDIGLLRLVGNIDFDLNPQIFPVCVIGPEDEQLLSIDRCLVTGWPEMPEMEPWRSRTFMSWGSVSVSRSNCPTNTPNSCCYGQACVANRGSPLICLSGSQRYYIWGLVPQDMNCGRGARVSNVPVVSVVDNYDFISRYLNTPNPNVARISN